MPSLDETDEAQKCVCLQWAIAGSAEEDHDVEEDEENGDAVAASE